MSCCSKTGGDGPCTCKSVPKAVALPKKAGNNIRSENENSTKRPVWAISSTEDGAGLVPLSDKCDRHLDERHGVCCKDLVHEDKRALIDPDVVRDIVIGLSDGLTVPFALTAGLSGIGSSHIVIIGGLAELIAGAISMGVGGFLASQSERDHYRYLRRHTTEYVQRSCDGEMEREIHAILGPVGLDEKLSVQVADCLRKVESQVPEGNNPDNHTKVNDNAGLEDGETPRRSQNAGLAAFLLKFGEGLEEVPTKRIYISAFTIGASYFFGGLIPLLPYFFIHHAQRALIYSAVITSIILLIFGIFKTHVTGAVGGWKGYTWGAVSTLAVGGSAAAAAFGIVRALE